MSEWASEAKIAEDGFLVLHTGMQGPAQSRSVSIKKCDTEQQLVFGEVYVPGFPDSQGEFMTAAGIQQAAYTFMRKGLTNNVDLQHDFTATGCYIVESFIAREGDPVFIPGSWVIGVKVVDPALWSMIKDGSLNGFSFGGTGYQVDTVIELDLPETVEGVTMEAEGHDHQFAVHFSPDGEFKGGVTGPAPDGHIHTISRGTMTDAGPDGHTHRYSFTEGVLCAQS